MPDYPLLRLGKAHAVPPRKGTGGPPTRPRLPSTPQQVERIGPRFDRLAEMLAEGRDPLALHEDPARLAPERVLVFEVAGTVANFEKAVARVAGLEYLGGVDAEFPPDDDFWVVDTRKDTKDRCRDDMQVGGCVYMAMPDLRALNELLGLWRTFEKGATFATGLAPWRHLFSQLKDLRPWGPEDRVTPGARADFHGLIAANQSDLVPVEIELWPRRTEAARRHSGRKVSGIVGMSGGAILHESVIPEIGYHAVLAEVPRSEINRLSQQDCVQLAVCDDIMYIRPQSLASLSPVADPSTSAPMLSASGDIPPHRSPIAALLDGMPVQRHRLLDGRIIVDDPDGVENESEVARRRHGTAMASLIIHGDLSDPDGQPPLSRPLHVHPVLREFSSDLEDGDGFHPRRLLIDTFHRAIKRMKEGEADEPPSSPHVFLVNVSLGDQRRPYANQVSPWARLLDYLAWRYGILFLVSAGNIREPLPVSGYSGMSAFEDVPGAERQTAVLRALSQQRSERTLLSPAEAINVVTVGACHDGADSPTYKGSLVDPFESRSLPNVSSALGLGHLRTVKPDVLMPGGREHLTLLPGVEGPSLRPANPGHAFGVSAAAPSPSGDLANVRATSGTSAATALATRFAHQVFDALRDLDNDAILADADPRHRPLIVRALLVHSCRWDETAAEQVEQVFGPPGQYKSNERGDNVARVLGRGVPDVGAVTACAPERATMIGFGEIRAGEVMEHGVPLPASLSGVRVPRSVTVTLAWFSPVAVRSRAYRNVKLDVRGHSSSAFGTEQRSLQPRHHATRRGTVLHECYAGDKVKEFAEGDRLSLRISCTTPAGPVDEAIPYGIAVTIEAGEEVPIYEEIRTALAVPVRA